MCLHNDKNPLKKNGTLTKSLTPPGSVEAEDCRDAVNPVLSNLVAVC